MACKPVWVYIRAVPFLSDMKSVNLRLMTANCLHRFGVEPSALADFVRREAPDVLALQELSVAQARAIESLGDYPHGTMDPRDDSFGLGLLLRFPAEMRRLRLPLRDSWIAEIDLRALGAIPREGAAEVLQITNVHLTAPHHLPPWKMLWQRHQQVRALDAHFRRNAPVRQILLGDLNSTPLFPAYHALCARFRDAALIAASRNGGRTHATWAPRPGWRPLLRIDHALVDSSIDVKSLRVLPLAGSDHSAILVDVTIPCD